MHITVVVSIWVTLTSGLQRFSNFLMDWATPESSGKMDFSKDLCLKDNFITNACFRNSMARIVISSSSLPFWNAHCPRFPLLSDTHTHAHSDTHTHTQTHTHTLRHTHTHTHTLRQRERERVPDKHTHTHLEEGRRGNAQNGEWFWELLSTLRQFWLS